MERRQLRFKKQLKATICNSTMEQIKLKIKKRRSWSSWEMESGLEAQ